MKKSILASLLIMFLAALTLEGCILVPVDDGYRGGDYHDRGRGGHHGERHEGYGDRR